MKANRKTMLGVALAVAVIALAGIGYAAYTGTATSSGNNITTKYVNIQLDKTSGNGQIETTFWDGQTLPVEFDSMNDNGTIKYKLNADSAVKTLEITVTIGGNDDEQNYKLEISVPSVSSAGLVGSWKYTSGGNNYTVVNNKITVETGTIGTLDGTLILSLAASANWEAGPIEDQIDIDPITFTVTSL